jgi:hypothetical protein
VIEDDDAHNPVKRGRQYWMETVVGGQRYRESLHTTDWREAKDREKERPAELARRPADPTQRGRSYGSLDVTKAIDAYARGLTSFSSLGPLCQTPLAVASSNEDRRSCDS